MFTTENQIRKEIDLALARGDCDELFFLSLYLARITEYETNTNLMNPSKTHTKSGPARGTIRKTKSGYVTEAMSRDHNKTKKQVKRQSGLGRRNPKHMSSKHVDWEDEVCEDYPSDLMEAIKWDLIDDDWDVIEDWDFAHEQWESELESEPPLELDPMPQWEPLPELTNEVDKQVNTQAFQEQEVNTELFNEHKTHAKSGPTRGTIRKTKTGYVTEAMSRDYTRTKPTKVRFYIKSGHRNPKYMSSKHVDWEDDDSYDWKVELSDYYEECDLQHESESPLELDPMPEWAEMLVEFGCYTTIYGENGKFLGVE